MNSLAEKFASGIARLTPFGKRVDDPLTRIKAATRWVENLPSGDAFKSQQVIFDALKRFNENSTQYTKDRLAIFMLLDEKSRDLQDTLVRQYLRNPRMSRAQESQLWHAVDGQYWEVARGYHTFVLHLARETDGNQHDKKVVPLITLRAIRTFGQLLKWRAIRYLPAGEELWLRLHNLYRIAETGGFHRQPQRAYAEDASDCSCETAHLHILMLNLANSGTLYPKQLDLLDRWLPSWHGMLQLDSDFDPKIHNFAVDLSADHGPRRVRKPDADKPLRFWTTAALQHKLHEIQTALQQGGSPAELGLTENARMAESLELLEHLQRQWSPLSSREQRRAPRESIKLLVDITRGLNAIVSQIKAANTPASVSLYGAGLNYNEAEVEWWVMYDESKCGYGAIVESRDKDWLRVGALIGIKPHEASEWQVGIVRRLSRVSDDTSSVGIETLAETPVLAMLRATTTSGHTVNGHDDSGASLPHACLWLAGSTGADSVIIDPAHFAPGKIFQVQGIPERKLIALGNQIERSEGWMRVIVEPTNN